MKVMIVVTHLLGTGHLARALTLARAYNAAGDEAVVLSGGMPAPLLDRGDVEIIQLPPLRSDGVDFTRLRTDTGIAGAQDFATRRAALLAALDTQRPDVLITELFPFGRRMLRDEFEGLLKAAQGQYRAPLICASIRDILAPPSKPRKATFADEMVAQYYDAVLVHSDPTLTPLEASWPVSGGLRRHLHYTGFVAPAAAKPHPDCLGRAEILVSAGGGDVGRHVYAAALGAAPLLADVQWRLLIGGAAPQARVLEMRAAAPPNVRIEPARPEFRQMLRHAAASVSLCGYNTALDILQAGTPAVFVPFDDGNEVEQGLRAKALAQQSGIAVLARAALSPETLRDTLVDVMSAPRRALAQTGFDGAAQTVRITRKLREDMA